MGTQGTVSAVESPESFTGERVADGGGGILPPREVLGTPKCRKDF